MTVPPRWAKDVSLRPRRTVPLPRVRGVIANPASKENKLRAAGTTLRTAAGVTRIAREVAGGASARRSRMGRSCAGDTGGTTRCGVFGDTLPAACVIAGVARDATLRGGARGGSVCRRGATSPALAAVLFIDSDVNARAIASGGALGACLAATVWTTHLVRRATLAATSTVFRIRPGFDFTPIDGGTVAIGAAISACLDGTRATRTRGQRVRQGTRLATRLGATEARITRFRAQTVAELPRRVACARGIR